MEIICATDGGSKEKEIEIPDWGLKQHEFWHWRSGDN
jgi:hypothetical protein